MSNHVHLIAVPTLPRWTCAGMQECSWQVRCMLERDPRCKRARLARALLFLPAGRRVDLWAALHYTEREFCRDGLVSEPEWWPWTSVVVLVGKHQPSRGWLTASGEIAGGCGLARFVAAREAESDLAPIRRCTHTGRPLGDAAFNSKLEQTTGRRLRPQSKGRRKESTQDPRQASLSLDAPPV